MRAIPPDLAASLDAGATTLCHCWLVITREGARQGFTDHDGDLGFADAVFLARSGLEGGAVQTELGFAIGGAEAAGALTSDAITEADLAGGRYDGASVETWLVDWSNVDARLLLDVFTLGEVKRSEFAFTAELRSIAHDLDQETGRLYRAGCAADLGDARCRVDLADPAYRFEGAVLATDGRLTLVVAAQAFGAGWFTGGVATLIGGANAGLRATIKSHVLSAEGASLALWTPLARPLRVGDALVLTAGCDKSLPTCAAKFANQANFQGFPHIPGLDVLMRYADSADVAMDGGSLFR